MNVIFISCPYFYYCVYVFIRWCTLFLLDACIFVCVIMITLDVTILVFLSCRSWFGVRIISNRTTPPIMFLSFSVVVCFRCPHQIATHQIVMTSSLDRILRAQLLSLRVSDQSANQTNTQTSQPVIATSRFTHSLTGYAD